MRHVFVCGALLLVASSIGGCAFTVHDVPLNYNYAGTLAPSESALPSVQVGDFQDVRDVANKRMIANAQNLNRDTTTGGWQAEKDLALIVKDAFAEGAAQLGAGDKSKMPVLLLAGELTDVTSRSVVGLVRGTFAMQIRVRLTLRDQRTGEIIYRDSVTGEGSANSGNVVRSAFNTALTNLVDRALNDAYFRQQLSRAASSS